jgi:multisubunit Na+/H+ antiporter MnhE subunit
MGISISNDFILGMVIGAIIVLVLQQFTRMAGSMGRLLPLVLFGLVLIAVLMLLVWTGS